MIKQLLYFTIALFFSAQALALGHLSEHELDQHQHQDQVCAAWLHAQLNDTNSVGHQLDAPVFAAVSCLAAALKESAPSIPSPHYFHSRAPPTSV